MIFKFAAINLIISLGYLCLAKITDKQYASMPDLFYMDNYDKCLALDQIYCRVQYDLQPLDLQNPPPIWKIIEEVSSCVRNYRHDHLRHAICVPVACPNVNITDLDAYKDVSILRDRILKCYNEKYKDMGLEGNITSIRCEMSTPRHKVDFYDIAVAVVFALYILLVICASFYEGVARYKSKEEYEKSISTSAGKILAAFSIPKNWERLTTVKLTPEIEKLRCIQGIRVYNMFLIILAHASLFFVVIPILNTKYSEGFFENPFHIIFSNNGFGLCTYFLISSWMLSYNFFLLAEKKKITGKELLVLFVHRYLRLTPLLLIFLIFHGTWLVHLGNGPFWDFVNSDEYENCRTKWWQNLLYLNNLLDPEHMCMHHTWTLAIDTIFYAMGLVILYYVHRNPTRIHIILGTFVGLHVVDLFILTYVNHFPALDILTPEKCYNIKIFEDYYSVTSVKSMRGNASGLILGLWWGYIYYKYRNQNVFTKKIHVVLWWITSLPLAIFICFLPENVLHFCDRTGCERLPSAVFTALGRTVFVTSMGFMIFGITQGLGWMVKWTTEWWPTYLIGRVTYGTYFGHVTLGRIKFGQLRSGTHLSIYVLLAEGLSMFFSGYILGTIVTLLFELPISALEKLIIPQRKSGELTKTEKKAE